MLHGPIDIKILMLWNANVGGKFSGLKMLLSELLEWRNVNKDQQKRWDFWVILLISLISKIKRKTEDDFLSCKEMKGRATR